MTVNRKLRSAAILLGALLATTTVAATQKTFSPPAGTKVASGSQFDIYVLHKQSRPFAGTDFKLSIYQVTVVVHNTRKHGRQRFSSRTEAVNADLLDRAMWQIGDFDGDGFNDYRAVAGITKQGCRTWATQTWLPDRERFTFGAKISYSTNAGGKQVKSCIGYGS